MSPHASSRHRAGGRHPPGGHGHGHPPGDVPRRLGVALVVALVVLVAEVVGGLLTGSLALLADATHAATDAAGVGLVLFATVMAARPPSPTRTYGWQRTEVLAAAVNAVLLLGAGGWVVVEAVRRLADPQPVEAGGMLLVAGLGLLANAGSLLVLRSGRERSLGLRTAYLEVLADLLGSAAVLLAAVVVAVTGSPQADPVVSLVIGAALLPRSWRLLRDAVDVLLEAAPRDVDLLAVRAHLLSEEGVLDVHDLHAWTITHGVPVLSAHVVVADAVLADGHGSALLDRLLACLEGHFDVEHSTLQLETPGHRDHEPVLHA